MKIDKKKKEEEEEKKKKDFWIKEIISSSKTKTNSCETFKQLNCSL